MNRERIADLAVGVIASGIYLLTLAPTITWRNNGADSGDLVSAAFTLGIPHPTGYPLFTILAAIISHLPLGEPAKNVNAFSAVASSGAIVLTAIAGRQLVRNSNSLSRWVPRSFALVFAFAPALWSQATIAEVNAVAIFLAAALFAVLLSDSPRRLFFAAAMVGIGLTHHLTILLLVPAAIILLASTRWTARQLTASLLALIAPLVLYLYLPLRAFTHPPINWGDPETLDGFLWVITGSPYRQYLFSLSPAEVFGRVALIARLLFEQFTIVGVMLGLWGAFQMGMRSDIETRRKFLALLLAFVLPVAYAVVYASRDSFVYLLPAFLVFLFWMMYGANDLIANLLGRVVPGLRGVIPSESKGATRQTPPPVWGAGGMRAAAIIFPLILFPLYNLTVNFNAMNLSSDYAAYDYAKTIFSEIPRQTVVIADGDEHLFALQYYRNVIAPQSDVVVVSAELLQYSWYFNQVRRMLPNVNGSVVTQPDRLVEVMDASLAQGRGLYVTLHNELLSRYATEIRDGYYRVIRRLP